MLKTEPLMLSWLSSLVNPVTWLLTRVVRWTSVDQLDSLAEVMTAGLVDVIVEEFVGLDGPGVIARDGRVGPVRETSPALLSVAEQNRLC